MCRAGVSPLHPDPWADPQILLPSLCCSKPPPCTAHLHWLH